MRIKIKLLVIAGLLVLLAVPLLLVVSKIYERSAYRDEARSDIAHSWTGEQRVLGPVLIVPYKQVLEDQQFDTESQAYKTHEVEHERSLLLVPAALAVETTLDTEIRYRGIYEVPVYTSKSGFSGEFSTERIVTLLQRDDVREIGEPVLSIGVSDARGMVRPPALNWGGARFEFEPGSALSGHPTGIHAQLGEIDTESATPIAFDIELELRGMASFAVAPVGDSTSVAVQSNWKHPRFEGLYLPVERAIGNDGFTAAWQTSRFATNIVAQASACSAGDCTQLVENHLGVKLVEPVDIYLQAQRATKYGMLFIGLTFTAFFLFEVLRKLVIHPIQYGLVGLALAIFYLLLVSMAEHVAFGVAYGAATAACCGLLAFYVSYVLGSAARGIGFGASVGLLYGVLFVIIQAEDFALAMGAALVFAALAAVMYITRSIDWYAVSGPGSEREVNTS